MAAVEHSTAAEDRTVSPDEPVVVVSIESKAAEEHNVPQLTLWALFLQFLGFGVRAFGGPVGALRGPPQLHGNPVYVDSLFNCRVGGGCCDTVLQRPSP